MESGHIINVAGLQKSYGEVKALRGVDFYLEKGALFALLGENGAGKSTTIDILAGLLKPDGGNVDINGYRLGQQNNKIRRSIGIVFQNSMLDGLLTVRENLACRSSFYGYSADDAAERIREIAAPLGIGEFLDRRYGKLSGGQRRRADIARALLHRPQILFLDEPTTGLDPASRRAIWEMVRAIQQELATTVLLTTHYMEEAAGADYVVVLGHGQVLAKGTPAALKREYTGDVLRLEAQDLERLAEQLAAAHTPCARQGGVLQVPLAGTLEALPILQAHAAQLRGFEVVQGTMDDAFLRIIGAEREGGGLL